MRILEFFRTLFAVYKLIVVHHDAQEEKIDQSADLPLLTHAFTLSMKNCPTGSPIHIRVIAEFDFETKRDLFIEPDQPMRIKDEPSVRMTEIFDQEKSLK